MEDEPILKIDDEEYKIADLSDKAKDLVESLRFTEAELGRAKAMVAVLETARSAYLNDLNNNLPAVGSSGVELN